MAEPDKISTRKRTRQSLPMNLGMEHGKLPPQAVDLEEAVLGALMLEKEAVNAAIDILQQYHHYCFVMKY